jgi:NAD(P)-dependent dehydrogenase (short-subunit alcohol dehydrogenase family)
LFGPLLLAKHGASMLEPGGSIVFTSGIAAYRPGPRASLLAALNGALASLAAALAVELAPIRVNVVSPGWVDTTIWQDVAGDAAAATLAAMAARLPAGRIGRTRTSPPRSSPCCVMVSSPAPFYMPTADTGWSRRGQQGYGRPKKFGGIQ